MKTQRGSAARFLLAGGVNTLITYLAYLGLARVFAYQVSFAIAFALGIGLAYCFNRIFVFKSHRGYQSVLMQPLVYLLQYVLSAALIHVWVEVLHLSAVVAPLAAVAATLPATFVLSRLAFLGRVR